MMFKNDRRNNDMAYGINNILCKITSADRNLIEMNEMTD